MAAMFCPGIPLKDSMKLKGKLEIFDRKKNGEWYKVLEHHNLVVTAGRNLTRDRLFTNETDYVQYGAVGTGTTAPTLSDTALETPLDSRQAFDTVRTTTDAQAQVDWTYTFDEANGDHSEAGLFCESTGGTMLCRAAFTPSTKDSTVERLYRWTIDISGA